MNNKYQGGFTVQGPCDWTEVEWIYSNKHSTDSKLVFQAYDANLWPLPNFSTWLIDDWKQKQINKALLVTKDFAGEVWLDDTKVKEAKK